MASLSIRKLNDQVYHQLRERAEKHHISIEEEVRQIITQAVDAPEKISDVFLHYFGQKNGIDISLPIRSVHQPIEFDHDID